MRTLQYCRERSPRRGAIAVSLQSLARQSVKLWQRLPTPASEPIVRLQPPSRTGVAKGFGWTSLRVPASTPEGVSRGISARWGLRRLGEEVGRRRGPGKPYDLISQLQRLEELSFYSLSPAQSMLHIFGF